MNEDRINDLLTTELQTPATEMATDLRNAKLKIMNKSDSLMEHFYKVIFYPADINQNKWRNEIATRLVECSRLKNSSTNKKFDVKVYELLFTTLCSDLAEFKEQGEAFYKEFLIEGLTDIDIDDFNFTHYYSCFRQLQLKSLSLLIEQRIAQRQEFRDIIDEILL